MYSDSSSERGSSYGSQPDHRSTVRQPVSNICCFFTSPHFTLNTSTLALITSTLALITSALALNVSALALNTSTLALNTSTLALKDLLQLLILTVYVVKSSLSLYLQSNVSFEVQFITFMTARGERPDYFLAKRNYNVQYKLQL